MESADRLRAFGFALGRFIYLMDAAVDLKDDIRRERYNPLVGIPSGQHEGLLRLLMAEATACYEQLHITRNQAILENILYSGVWTQLSQKNKKETAKQ